MRGRWIYERSKAAILHIAKQRHLATIPLFAYNFWMDGPILNIFGKKVDIYYLTS